MMGNHQLRKGDLRVGSGDFGSGSTHTRRGAATGPAIAGRAAREGDSEAGADGGKDEWAILAILFQGGSLTI